MRWIVVCLLTLSTILNLLDRQTLSILSPFLRTELHISVTQYSYVVAGFMASYSVMYAVGGWFVDRIGERIGMAFCIGWWSVCTMLTACIVGPRSLGAVRFLLGVGEPGNYPAALKATTRWFPKAERGLPVALFSSGSAIGNMIAAPLIAAITLWFGWRAAFLLPGALGLVWLLIWLLVYQSPKNFAGYSKNAPSEDTECAPAGPSKGWRSLFLNRNVIALVIARFISDPVSYFYVFWIPEYLKHERGFSLAEIGMYAWMPYVAGAMGGVMGGRWSDLLIRRGTAPVRARLWTLYVSAIGAPLGVFTSQVHSAALALSLMSLESFIVYCWFINTAAMIPDVAPPAQAGSILGLIGTAGSFSGMLFNLLVGTLVSHFGSYRWVFAIVGSVHLIAALVLRGLVRIPASPSTMLEECYEA